MKLFFQITLLVTLLAVGLTSSCYLALLIAGSTGSGAQTTTLIVPSGCVPGGMVGPHREQ